MHSKTTSTREIAARREAELRELIAERERVAQDIAALDQTIDLLSHPRPATADDVQAFDRAVDLIHAA